jgi:hypothetical protein
MGSGWTIRFSVPPLSAAKAADDNAAPTSAPVNPSVNDLQLRAILPESSISIIFIDMLHKRAEGAACLF